jgi:predicted phage tail protein
MFGYGYGYSYTLTRGPGGGAVSRLAAPANLTADVVDDDVTLEWDAVVDADHYEVKTNSGSWVVLGDVLTTELLGLDPGDYIVRVRAVAASGVKGYASSVAFEIEEVGGEVPADALLNEDGTPILNEDGEYILVES